MALCNLLALPYELRHKIYRAYFTVDDGYAFQPGSGKLVAADGPLDLSLMYTCRFIASETKDLPLKCNSISFSTVYHPEWRHWAGRFDYLLRAQLYMQTSVLISLWRFITPYMHSQIRAQFPWFVPDLENILQYQPVDDFEETHTSDYIDDVTATEFWNHSDTVESREDEFSGLKGTGYEVSQAVNFALRLVAQAPEIDSTTSLASSLQGWTGRQGLVDFLNECYEPWDIPSWSELESMGKRFCDHKLWSKVQGWEAEGYTQHPSDAHRSKFRFSAAAVAIRFLKHLSINKRMCIKKIIIHEDRIAVGHQERHAHGLLPFFRENPQLRIEVRVSLLTNILLAVTTPDDIPSIRNSAKDDEIDGPEIDIEHTYDQIGIWLAEALAVVDAGMPAGSYTLFLDGEPALDLFSDIFQRFVQRDAAFIAAVETCFPSPPGPGYGHDFSPVPQRALEAIVHLANQTSVLRCNFHPGQLWDVDKFVQEFRGRQLDEEEVYEEYIEQNHSIRISPLLNLWGLMMEDYEYRR